MNIYNADTNNVKPAKFTVLFWVLYGAFSFVFASSRALWDPGEGRYGAIAAEMVKTGDWLVPHLNGVFYFEKPPLGYWLNAICIKIFGFNEFAVRFPTVMAALLTILGVYYFTKRVYGQRTASAASMVCATSAGFLVWTQVPELDMLLSMLMLFGIFLIYTGFELKIKPALSIHLGYIALGLACLVKGPMAYVLPFGIFFVYLTLTNQWRRWKDLYPFTGIPIALITAALWFVPVCLKEPEFFNFFFIREHFQRFTTQTHSRKGAYWYFIPVFAGMLFPWVFIAPQAFKKAFSEYKKGELISRTNLFILITITVIFLFFSVSGSKRPPYVLPCVIPAAILAANYLLGIKEKSARIFIYVFACLNLIIAVAIPFVMPKINDLKNLDFTLNFAPVIIIFAVWSIALFMLNLKKRADCFAITNAWFMTAFIAFAAFLTLPPLDYEFSRRQQSKIINSQFNEGDKILSFDAFWERNMQSVNFYTDKRVIIYGAKGELDFGSKHAPDADEYFVTREKALELISGDKRYFVFYRKKHRAALFGAENEKLHLYDAEDIKGKIGLASNRPFKH